MSPSLSGSAASPQVPPLPGSQTLEPHAKSLIQSRISHQARRRLVADYFACDQQHDPLEEAEGKVEIVHDHNRQSLLPAIRQHPAQKTSMVKCIPW